MPALPAAGVGSGQCVSVGEPESLTLGVASGFPLEFQVGLLQTFATAQGWGNRGPEGCSAWRRNTQQTTGGGVLATYLRNRRNVHSLAQPTGETRGLGGQAHLPAGPMAPPSQLDSPYCPNLSDIFPPQRDWLRGERRGWQL